MRQYGTLLNLIYPLYAPAHLYETDMAHQIMRPCFLLQKPSSLSRARTTAVWYQPCALVLDTLLSARLPCGISRVL